MILLTFGLLVFLVSSESAVECAETTTTVYDLPVRGSSPIRIVEGEPLWRPGRTNHFEHRSFTTDVTRTNLHSPLHETSDEEREKSDALKDFLANYAENLRKSKPMPEEEPESEPKPDKSKSWDLVSVHKHKHPSPYEDKKGWVSLEPVPWSISKISKWHPNRQAEKPYEGGFNDKTWESNEYEKPYKQESSYEKPYKPDSSYFSPKPTVASDKYDVYYVNKPDVVPTYPKPSALFSQKVHVDYPSYKKKPSSGSYYTHDHDEDCKHNENSEIITDGLPPNFPPAYPPETVKRHADAHHESHPFNGEGEWVLLSTTKGYKYPKHRQRSIDVNNVNSIGSHQAVRLTVLPPLKGSKINMTTSHGGLLQVESTFETVEQARDKFMKKQKNKRQQQQQQKPTKRRRKQKPQKAVASKPRPRPSKLSSTTTATVPRRTPESDSSAVLAAVGAGMIPATMAMLMPMAMNGKRRRRDVDGGYFYTPPTQFTLPRRYF